MHEDQAAELKLKKKISACLASHKSSEGPGEPWMEIRVGKEMAVPHDLSVSQLSSQHTHTRAKEKSPAGESKPRPSIEDLQYTGKTYWLVVIAHVLRTGGGWQLPLQYSVLGSNILTALGTQAGCGSAGTIDIHTHNPATPQSPRGESSPSAAHETPGMDVQYSHLHSSGEQLTGKVN